MEKDSINNNMHFLFEKPEEEAREINKKIQALMRTCTDIEKIKQIIARDYGNGEEFFEDTYLNDLIVYLTSKEYEGKEKLLLDEMKILLNVNNTEELGNGIYKIERKDGDIVFRTVNSFLEHNLPKEKFETDKDLIKYVDTVQDLAKRTSKCHSLALDVAAILMHYFRINATVVTGYNSYYVPNNRYLHSWLELESFGKPYVLDSTSNFVMNKEAYYMLRKVQENEILSKISADQVLEDGKKYFNILNELDLKTYLTARDELVRDLEKNKHLFENKDEEER